MFYLHQRHQQHLDHTDGAEGHRRCMLVETRECSISRPYKDKKIKDLARAWALVQRSTGIH